MPDRETQRRWLLAPVSDTDHALMLAATMSMGRDYKQFTDEVRGRLVDRGLEVWHPLAIMEQAIEIAMYHGMALHTQTSEGGCAASTRLNGAMATYLEYGADRELDLMRAIVKCAAGIFAGASGGEIGRRTMTVGAAPPDQTVNASPTSSPASPSP